MIMPTGHECSCCCEVERVSEDHVSPGRVVLGPNVPCQDMMSPLPPPLLSISATFLAIESWAWGLRTRLAAFSKALLRTLTQRISLVPRPHPKIEEKAWLQLAKIPVCAAGFLCGYSIARSAHLLCNAIVNSSWLPHDCKRHVLVIVT